MIHTFGPLHDKLVLMGMSCVGKSTFAAQLKDHKHHSFDARYRYNLDGLPGISKRKQWERIARGCTEPRWVLDNWSTEDLFGETLFSVHPDACVVVLFDSLPNILKRYRVPVTAQDGHLGMWSKMYRETPFVMYSRVRFFRVHTERDYYHEHHYGDYRLVVDRMKTDLGKAGFTFDEEKWVWRCT